MAGFLYRPRTPGPTLSDTVHANSGQLQYFTSAEPQVAPRSHGTRSHTHGRYQEISLSCRQSIIQPLARFGSTSAFELSLYSIRAYVFGSFETGTWFSIGADKYCESSKAPAETRLISVFDQINHAKMSLRSGDLSVAKYRFSLVCRSAKERLETEDFTIIPDLGWLFLQYLSTVNWDERKLLKASLELVGRHFARMASIIFGSKHPLASILSAFYIHIRDEDTGVQLQTLLKGLLDTYEQVLGRHHLECVWLKLRIARPDGDTSLLRHWDALEACDQEYGLDSIQSLCCFEQLTYQYSRSYDAKGVAKMLNILDERRSIDGGSRLTDNYALLFERLRMLRCWKADEWIEAAAILEADLIPIEMKIFGVMSDDVESRLRDLEYCLQRCGNWHRLGEVRSWRQSIWQHLFVEDADDDA